MKKLSLMLLIVLFIVLNNGFTQVRWGEKILLGDRFTNTDSLRLLKAALTDTMFNADTLYSGALEVGDKEGIFAVAFFADRLSGTPTYTVQARLYFKTAPAGERWTVWNNVFSAGTAADTLNTLSYSRDGISWWMESNLIQYRVIQAGIGQAVIYLSDYLK